MHWSTRQLAKLAGTTSRAVRHYHEVGLLDEPGRGVNGYKQYGTGHLVRVLRIRRLVDLGLSLPQIAVLGDSNDTTEDALRQLDAELAKTAKRIKHVRAELAVILRDHTPVDLPTSFGQIGAGLADSDRALVLVYSRMLNDSGLEIVKEMLRTADRTDADLAFDTLAADAPDTVRQHVAEQYTPQVRRVLAQNPSLTTLAAHVPHGPKFADDTMSDALTELYNPAQLDVVARVRQLLLETTGDTEITEKKDPHP